MEALPSGRGVVCGWCRYNAHLNLIGAGGVQFYLRDVETPTEQGAALMGGVAGLYQCPRCRRPSLLTFAVVSTARTMKEARLLEQFPDPVGEAEEIRGLPAQLAADREEAWRCYGIKAYNAATVMARAALQRAVRILGANKPTLHAEIMDLFEQHQITAALKDAALRTKALGNEVAHPDKLGAITAEEARESLELLDDFLHMTFGLQARLSVDTGGDAG